MRSILSPANFESADLETFVAEVLGRPFFDETPLDVFVARAPGRLDLMGGIADYSGSLVLQWPLREATLVAAQCVQDGRLHAISLTPPPHEMRTCDLALAELFPHDEPLSYEAARTWFARHAEQSWAAYVFGVLIVLARETGWRPKSGLRLLIRSDVPEGKGVSSSAALEVSTMKAVAAAVGLAIEARELALLSQMVENRIVGAACGVMDQMTSSCGVAGQLLALLCQPAELRGTIALPDDLEIWGIDSGVRHAVSGSDYTSVRVGAFMGARMLDEKTGYLVNLTPSELDNRPFDALPESIKGSEFLERYGGISDTVARIEPSRTYAVRACSSHPIRENARVQRFAELLRDAPGVGRSRELGELMFQSHASYSACGLGSDATDRLVNLVRSAGAPRGFYGAKITGGGSGGTVAVLGRRGADIGEIVRANAEASGHTSQVFSGSSPGAAAFGTLRLGTRP
ncbi:MAG: galactokinase family protein [Vicinamibacteria bacterium]